jgi:L-fuconolactonase
VICDAQVHIWAADSAERPWPPPTGKPPPTAPWPEQSIEKMVSAMDSAGVDRAVICPPLWEGVRNDYALEAAKRHPSRFAVLGRVDLDDPEKSRKLIPAWRKQPGMLGLRHPFHRPEIRGPLVEGKLDWLFEEAEKADCPIMLFLPLSDMNLVATIAKRHPKLKLTLDHFALTHGKDDEAFHGFEKLLEMAAYPNVSVKATCLPAYTTDTYPFRRVHPYVKRVFEAFGPKRMFWGSDLTRLSTMPYRQTITMFTEEMPWLSKDDLDWIMGRGVCEWLGWTS